METKVFVQKMPKSIALAIAIGTIGCLLHDKPPPPRPALRGHPAVPRPEQAILSACVLAFNAGKLALRVLYFLNLLRSPHLRTDADLHPARKHFRLARFTGPLP